MISVAVGAVVGAAAGLVSPSLAPLAGWCTAALVALIWVWRVCWPLDSDGTRRLAREESRSRVTDDAVVTACLISLAAVVLALVQSSHQTQDPVSVTLVILGVLATILSWALVNSVYALKYARLYFLDEREGGVDFNQDAAPTYSDFAYLAFTIGMSYSVADTEPSATATRRKALPHALLSYFFGTIIIAVAINLVTNLAQS